MTAIARPPRQRVAASCPVRAYARRVDSGKIVAGRLVQLACQRHLRDLAEGAGRGLRWDQAAADRAIQFFSFLHLPDGKPFVLEPFEAFIVGSLFGWKGPDGFRRFRTAYCEIGKGNGKSPTAAGIGLYGLTADDEPAAEVYSAATTREQAGICFRDAKLMAQASPALKERLHILDNNLSCRATNSFFRPVSSEHRGLDGKRPHMAILDELHEHPNSLVVDKMRAGTKSRRSALIVEITNSGYDRNSVCWNHHEYSAKVLEGVVDNDSWFAYVCTLDPCPTCYAAGKRQPTDGCAACDQWTDEKVWLKANPGLDAILPRKYLREQVLEAQGIPAKMAICLRLNFCVWTEAQSRAIDMEHWRASSEVADAEAALGWRERTLERLAGRSCHGGLDLGSTSDLTAFVLLFAPLSGEKKWTCLPWFWLPADNARQRTGRERVPYELWARQGLITTTEGNVTDYERVRRDVNALAERYLIGEIAVDRTFDGTQLCTQLAGDGQNVIAFGQGFLSMAAPVKRLLELVQAEELEHGANPVLSWMASNASARQDPAGNLKFDKSASAEKIDGIVALTMALGRAMLADAGSVYDNRGIFEVGARGAEEPEAAPTWIVDDEEEDW